MSFPDEANAGERLDRFFGGGFSLFQPLGKGFRAGLDALLLAATVPAEGSGRIADLGAGTGAVGFGAASRAKDTRATLVELAPELTRLLHRSVLHPANEALSSRLSVIEGDLLAGKAAREAAGLVDGAFDLVLTNPPFYPSDHRSSPDADRRRALQALAPDFLTKWLRASAALVAARGRLCLIARPGDLPEIAEALRGRLGGIGVTAVHTRPGPATRILVGASRGSRRGLAILPALSLVRSGEGASERELAIAAGQAHLDLFGT